MTLCTVYRREWCTELGGWWEAGRSLQVEVARVGGRTTLNPGSSNRCETGRMRVEISRRRSQEIKSLVEKRYSGAV